MNILLALLRTMITGSLHAIIALVIMIVLYNVELDSIWLLFLVGGFMLIFFLGIHAVFIYLPLFLVKKTEFQTEDKTGLYFRFLPIVLLPGCLILLIMLISELRDEPAFKVIAFSCYSGIVFGFREFTRSISTSLT